MKRVIGYIILGIVLLGLIFTGVHFYKINQFKANSIKKYPYQYNGKFVYTMSFFSDTQEEGESYIFTKANKIEQVKMKNEHTIAYKEKRGKSILETTLDDKIGTQLELYLFIVKNNKASDVKMDFSMEGIRVTSNQIANLNFSLVSNKRINELTVNPPKNPKYAYFQVDTDEKTIIFKLTGKRDKQNYAKWIVFTEDGTLIKKVTAY
ncbi:hypothetical protein [Listeria fleischmannii]|uniref:hypothetical protein n=1 Tax=Listeria fleischmannii TaxID=1069827 RepID=UPI000254F65C|nr:hypothetical protein [Listeria fleischmannii]EIA20110.1 hypothetical protein KKC_08777 [Listeria fleischmannii subsp. coloradonensis]STY34404.1 Uncharacterised protein [Listeria fleischmannii subsp. coloradonensis]